MIAPQTWRLGLPFRRSPELPVSPVLAAALYAVSAATSAAAGPVVPPDPPAVLSRYCADCHAGGEPEGGVDLDLSEPERLAAFAADPRALRLALNRLKNREMPPEYSDAPEGADRATALAWLAETASAAACEAAAETVPPAPIRRLTRTQYRWTMRDLLGIDFPAGEGLPADGGGEAGFDNAAEALFLSPLHAEKYLEAARSSLAYAARAASTREDLFPKAPGDATLDGETVTEEDAADAALWKLMRGAFRRDVTWDERQAYLGLYRQAREAGDRHEDALLHAMSGVLVSPNFLFRVEPVGGGSVDDGATAAAGDGDGHARADGPTLAVRLSYFLWSSMPDGPLRHRAAKGKLGDAAGLRAEVDRMLKDERADRFADDFAGQWLRTGELGTSFRPNRDLFPGLTDYTLEMLRAEPGLFLADLLRTDGSLLELIDADHAILTQDTAKHYGLFEALKPVPPKPKRYDLPDDSVRGGVVTMGAVLAVTSHPTRTSPTLRGTWALDRLLGDPPPPPPPDVPELEEENGGDGPEHVAPPATLRERLARHRADPACASCHDRIDPLGFGLENFDAVGRWRDADGDAPIDASGALSGGATFDGPDGLKRYLLTRKDDFVRNLAAKLLSYALGRGLTEADGCAVDGIVARVKATDYSSRELIFAVVESAPFLAAPPPPDPDELAAE